MKLKLHLKQEANGETRIINKIGAVLLLLLSFFNLLNQIHLKEEILNRLIYTVPYFIGAVLMYFLHWKYTLAFVLLFVGYRTTIGTDDPSSLSGAVFFCLSYACVKNPKYGVIIGLLTIGLLSIRSIKFHDTIPQTLAVILAFFAIYTLFYYIVIKALEWTIKKKLKSLTKKENKLVEYMANGKHQGTAGELVGYGDKFKTTAAMGIIRDKLGVKAEEATTKVIAIYMEYGK